MQRTRTLALISSLVALAILVGAVGLATYRRAAVSAAEEHEHEFTGHEHYAPAAHEAEPDEHPAPAGGLAEHHQATPQPEEPPAPSEPAPGTQPEPLHDHDHHRH